MTRKYSKVEKQQKARVSYSIDRNFRSLIKKIKRKNLNILKNLQRKEFNFYSKEPTLVLSTMNIKYIAKVLALAAHKQPLAQRVAWPLQEDDTQSSLFKASIFKQTFANSPKGKQNHCKIPEY